MDLDGKPEIEARVEHVIDTNRSTTLGKGNVKIHTVEHVLAAFAGLGVDNAIVELDANEPPIADGSSQEFARLIREAGVVAQTASREPYRITTPIQLTVGETISSPSRLSLRLRLNVRSRSLSVPRGAAGVAQAGTGLGVPRTETRHRRHAPAGRRRSS